MLLEVKNMTVCYQGNIEAISNVSFQIDQGASIAFIGSNGSGKSTIIKALLGLVTNVRGNIWFDGKLINHLPTDEIMKCGISAVLEGRRLFGSMSVLENLRIGAYRSTDRDAFIAGLEAVFIHFPVLRERVNQRAGTLSGGEQQMLAIGRALIAKPRLMVLDEPSFGIAPLVVRQIEQAIKKIKQNTGVTILLAEQSATLAFNLADRCYVMEHGSIILEGSTTDLSKDDQVRKTYLGIE